jgi:hypothetical protein
MPGYPIELGDGCEWLFPICLSADGESALPGRYARQDGRWVRDGVMRRLQPLDAEARAVYEQISTAVGRGHWSVNTEVGRLLELGLQANYYVGVPEMAFLRLVTEQGHQASAMAAVDLPNWSQAQNA